VELPLLFCRMLNQNKPAGQPIPVSNFI
jgi:hypothetical protein